MNPTSAVRRNRTRRIKVRHVPAREAAGFSSWMVDGVWAEPGQAPARHRPFFDSETKAKDFKLKIELQLRAGGVSAPVLAADDRVMFQRAVAKLKPYGKTVLQAVDHYVSYLQACANSRELYAVLAELIERKRADKLSDTHLSRIQGTCGRFVREFGGKMVSEMTVAEVDAWIAKQPGANSTKNSLRRYLSLLFGFAVRRGYCAENIAEKVDRRRESPGETKILTPEQVATLLSKAGSDIVPYIALRAFAGLRETEALRTDWSDIKLDRSLIELRAGKTKTLARRLIPVSPNLALWLKPYAKQFGPVVTVNRWTALRLLKKARKDAGITGESANELRHCYGSYRLAVTQNRNQVALEMGNSPAIVARHYTELVEPAAAVAFWGIVPTETSKPNVIPFVAG